MMGQDMRTFQLADFGKPLVSRTKEPPSPTGAEVLIRIPRCGVCHSDLHFQHGYLRLGGGKKLELESRGIKLPLVLGHEIVGEVAAVGRQVADFA